jgi:hypothetical protein
MTGTLAPAAKTCTCPQPCNGQTCALAALVRPRFFCGQLLTDQDLTDLTGWVLSRRKLGRYQSGWGVVCGLDVGIDPKAAATVLVQPGYAVSSCGEDVVLAAATGLGLTSCCPDLTPPGGTLAGEPPSACVVDIGVAYSEVGEDPVPALASCGQTGECEDTRILESSELRCAKVVEGSAPDRPEWRYWEQAYTNAVAVLEQAVADGLPGKASPDALRSWLRDRLRDEPPRHFGFVSDWVGQGDGPDPQRFAWLLFWIAQDRLLALMNGDCPAGCPGGAVPLARVWLAAEPGADKMPRWVVKAIDPVSPHRRPFGPAGWPAPFGRLNLGRVIWHRVEEAQLELRDIGVPVTDVAVWSPSTVEEVIAMIGSPPLVGGDESVSLRYVEPPPDAHQAGIRVVGFAQSARQGRRGRA